MEYRSTCTQAGIPVEVGVARGFWWIFFLSCWSVPINTNALFSMFDVFPAGAGALLETVQREQSQHPGPAVLGGTDQLDGTVVVGKMSRKNCCRLL